MTTKYQKYTEAEIAIVREHYALLRPDQGNRCLDEIAEMVKRSPASVRAKLVQVKDYVKDVKPTPQPKDEGPTKAELLDEFVQTVGKFDNRDGLRAATKATLVELIDLARKLHTVNTAMVDETELAA